MSFLSPIIWMDKRISLSQDCGIFHYSIGFRITHTVCILFWRWVLIVYDWRSEKVAPIPGPNGAASCDCPSRGLNPRPSAFPRSLRCSFSLRSPWSQRRCDCLSCFTWSSADFVFGEPGCHHRSNAASACAHLFIIVSLIPIMLCNLSYLVFWCCCSICTSKTIQYRVLISARHELIEASTRVDDCPTWVGVWIAGAIREYASNKDSAKTKWDAHLKCRFLGQIWKGSIGVTLGMSEISSFWGDRRNGYL